MATVVMETGEFGHRAPEQRGTGDESSGRRPLRPSASQRRRRSGVAVATGTVRLLVDVDADASAAGWSRGDASQSQERPASRELSFRLPFVDRPDAPLADGEERQELVATPITHVPSRRLFVAGPERVQRAAAVRARSSSRGTTNRSLGRAVPAGRGE